MLLKHRQYDRHGRIDWRASIISSMAASDRVNVRLGPITKPLVNLMGSRMSACLHCDTSWAFVKGHVTEYGRPKYEGGGGSGCFPLCEKCWADLGTPAARLPFYRALYELWLLDVGRKPYGPERFAALEATRSAWPLIEAAVRAGR